MGGSAFKVFLFYFRFSAFADLFSESVRRGLKGLKTQNPGLYYNQAALQAIQRKKLTQELTVDLRNTQLLPSLPQMSYYGQRPWRKSLTGLCNDINLVIMIWLESWLLFFLWSRWQAFQHGTETDVHCDYAEFGEICGTFCKITMMWEFIFHDFVFIQTQAHYIDRMHSCLAASTPLNFD